MLMRDCKGHCLTTREKSMMELLLIILLSKTQETGQGSGVVTGMHLILSGHNSLMGQAMIQRTARQSLPGLRTCNPTCIATTLITRCLRTFPLIFLTLLTQTHF